MKKWKKKADKRFNRYPNGWLIAPDGSKPLLYQFTYARMGNYRNCEITLNDVPEGEYNKHMVLSEFFPYLHKLIKWLNNEGGGYFALGANFKDYKELQELKDKYTIKENS